MERELLKEFIDCPKELLLEFIEWAKDCGEDAWYIYEYPDQAIERFMAYRNGQD